MGRCEENNVLLVPRTEHKEDQNPVRQTKQFKVSEFSTCTLKIHITADLPWKNIHQEMYMYRYGCLRTRFSKAP